MCPDPYETLTHDHWDLEQAFEEGVHHHRFWQEATVLLDYVENALDRGFQRDRRVSNFDVARSKRGNTLHPLAQLGLRNLSAAVVVSILHLERSPRYWIVFS